MIKRSNLAALALSAAALVGITAHEGYRETAHIPVKGDVPTLGFGSTAGVKLGDTITPEKALSRALTDIQAFEGALKKCVKVPLHQHEYDAAVSFSYNVGAAAFCGSTLVKKWNAGDYEGGCNELPRWVKAGGRVLPGLVKRREAERVLCLGLSINEGENELSRARYGYKKIDGFGGAAGGLPGLPYGVGGLQCAAWVGG